VTVEEVFQVTGQGVVLVPGPPLDIFGTQGKQHGCLVEIECPDGSSFEAEAVFSVPHFNPMSAHRAFMQTPMYHCVLNGVQKSDVPLGSVVFEVTED
jgi:hypothetical protein